MRLLLTVLLFLFASRISAQDFHRYYDLGGAESIRDLVVLNSDRLVAIGNSRDAEGIDRSILLTLDDKGEILRSTTLDYDLRTRGMALARQTDSTFWMGCWRTPFEIVDDWVVYLVNANTGEATGFGWGAVNVDEQIRGMATYPDGGVVVVGNTGDENEAILSRLDAQGNELFRKGFSIPDNQFTIFTDVKIAPNGNIYAAGGFQRTGGPTSKNGYLIAEFSPNGELLRSRRYDFPEGADGSDGAGVAFEFLGQGFMAMVGARRVGDERQSVAIILTPLLAVAVAFQGQAARYSTARGVLALGEDRLLIAGTGYTDDGEVFGLVTDFDVAGTDVPVNVAFNGRAANNGFSGITARPGGGYYFYGRGKLCPDEDGADGLLISIGESLTDSVANCTSTFGNARGREIMMTFARAGTAFDRVDPVFEPPAFVSAGASGKNKFCPRIAAYSTNLPDPICYEQPFILFDSVTLVSPQGSVDRITVVLAEQNTGATDRLIINNPPNGVVVEGNGSRRIVLKLVQGEGSELLTEALAQLQFATNSQAVAGGRRAVGVTPLYACTANQFLSYDFTLAPYLPAPFGLPADTLLCPGTELLLEGPELTGATYRWSNDADTRTITVTEPGDYSLSVSTGCNVESATVRVSAATDVTELTGETIRENVCLGDSLVFSPRAGPGIDITWADGSPAGEDRVIREPGIYELLRGNECSRAVTSLEVSFRDCCRVYLPNAFSPNGDGINDVFRAFPDTDKCGLLSDYQLSVFDRWGGLAYSGTSAAEGWDGRMNGKSAANGTYVYTYRYFNGVETVSGAGNVVLMR